MKKIFKYLIIILIVFFAYQFIDSKINPKPFRFEDFKTQEEAQKYFEKQYPMNSSIEQLLMDLRKSGGKCLQAKQELHIKETFNYKNMYICSSQIKFLPIPYLSTFNITIFTDINNKILKIYVFHSSNLK